LQSSRATAAVYREEHKDANATRDLVKREGSEAIVPSGDVGVEDFCAAAVEATMEQFGRIDILVHNADGSTRATIRIRTAAAWSVHRNRSTCRCVGFPNEGV